MMTNKLLSVKHQFGTYSRKEVIPKLLLSIGAGFGRRIFQYKNSYSRTCCGLMITTMFMISIFEL